MKNTHNKFIDFGKYKGERWTRLPLHYLRYLANQGRGFGKLMADAELERRGSTIPGEIELTGHAIDRASQMTDEWKEMGVHSWLLKIAAEAASEIIDDEVVFYKGYKFVFILGNHYPVLKTIIKKDEDYIYIEEENQDVQT